MTAVDGPGENARMAVPRSRTLRRPERSSAVRVALTVVLGLNAVVLAVKLVVGIRTGALSVLGAALESALDLFNNLFGLLIVAVAAREPDEEHPYGHDKFETLGALAIAGFLSISCFELFQGAFAALGGGRAPAPATGLEIAALVATGAINIFVMQYERKRGRELSSAFLLADAEHTRSDIYVTLLAVASVLISRAGAPIADPVLAIVVGLLIARSGYAIVRDTIPILVDQRGVDAERIRAIVRGVRGVRAVRRIRSRSSASGVLFAEVIIEVDGGTTVASAHAIADAVEERIESALGASEVTVHVEPSGGLA